MIETEAERNEPIASKRKLAILLSWIAAASLTPRNEAETKKTVITNRAKQSRLLCRSRESGNPGNS